MVLFPIMINHIFKLFKPVLIYAHGAQAVVAGNFFRRIYKIPLVARLYGLCNMDIFLRRADLALGRIYWALPEILAFKVKADLYVITADGTVDPNFCRASGLGDRILLLRNGVDLPKSFHKSDRNELKKEEGIAPETKVIVFVGRLEDFKRVDRILSVSQKAKEYNQPWQFIIVGDGRERVFLEDWQRKYDLPVKFVGAVPHQHVWRYLAMADVFLSLHDLSSISNTLLEALAMQIPVVCARKGYGIEELIKDGATGYLVDDPDNPDEVIAKIGEAFLLRDSLRLTAVPLKSWEVRFEEEFTRIDEMMELRMRYRNTPEKRNLDG